MADSRGLPPLPPQEAARAEAISKQADTPRDAAKNASNNLPPGWSNEVAAIAPRGTDGTDSGAPRRNGQADTPAANVQADGVPSGSIAQQSSGPATSTAVVCNRTRVSYFFLTAGSRPAVPSVPVNSAPFNALAVQLVNRRRGAASAGGLGQPVAAPQAGPNQPGAFQPGTPANANSPWWSPQLPGTQGQRTSPMMGPMRGMPPGGGFIPPFGPPPGFMPPFGARGQMPGGQPGIPGSRWFPVRLASAVPSAARPAIRLLPRLITRRCRPRRWTRSLRP